MSMIARLALVLLLLAAGPLSATSILLCGEEFTEPIAAVLDRLGLPYERVPASDLAGRDPAIGGALFLAHDAATDPAVVEWTERYLDAGGKLFSFFVLDPLLQVRLGVYVGGYYRPENGAFSAIGLNSTALQLPAAMRQGSWNINRAYPAADSVQTIGVWRDAQGQPTSEAAILLSPRGVHLTHVLLGQDPEGATRLYAALLGHFFPELWPMAVQGAVDAADRVAGGPDTLTTLATRVPRATAALARAYRSRKEAVDSLAVGRYALALDAAWRYRDQAVQALALAQPSRRGEFRGVWLHSPYGVADWGWEKTAAILAANGFNAIVANMLDAGRASYPSRVLPADPRVATAGEQLAQAVDAAHRHGLTFHAWKVNYNLGSADTAFVAGLRRQGRLQRNHAGEEVVWLCPSHPENLALETASLLEVVREYKVDGIHFDYIRYPDADACYCDGCRQRFQDQTGHPVSAWPEEVVTGALAESYQQWRCDQITRLVRTVSVQAKRIRAEIEISAAVFPDWPQTRASIGQDWIDWVKAGYLDFVCPMDYEPDHARFRRIVERQVAQVDGRIPLYPGIGAFRLVGTDDLIRQITCTRETGADGFIVFQYDAHLGEEVLPLLHQGMTRQRTHVPHRAPPVAFTAGEGGDPAGEPHYRPADEPVQLEVALTGGIQARNARGEVTLRSLDDQPVQELGALGSGAEPRLQATVSLTAGDYRPVLEGRYRDGRGKDRPFTWRGPILRLRDQAFLDSVAALDRPPRLWGLGAPVGILVDGYGGQALLAALADLRRIEPFAVTRLTPEILAATRVLVVPQPRQRSLMGRRERELLRNWIANGGRLLATHDMAGMRGLLPVVPEVCRRGIAAARSTQWRIAFDHPAVAGVGPGLHPHSYYDHVTLEPGRDGMVLAVDEEDRPTLVVGPHGHGWYAALGLVPGLAPDDSEVALTGAELQLVQSLVRWLAEEQ